MENSIIVHYSEIGTKGKNRGYFENLLINNIKKAIGNNSIYKRYGYVIGNISKNEEIRQKLSKIPGIANFSFAIKEKLDLELIKKTALEIAKANKFKNFKINAKRSNKRFSKSSAGINEEIGECIKNKLNKEVNLKNPELEIFIEIGEKEAFLYTEKFDGIGGLPVGASGNVIISLSGGIDSPVAAYSMMKRGCRAIFVHIFNKTINNEASLDKIERIAKILNEMQHSSKLYIVPFEELQKEIIENVPARLRMIVYRRHMMQILNKIADKENAKAIATGDNLGQVASQTIENLNLIWDKSDKIVLNPLIGMNKGEIIEIAKKIGTYEISILPYNDCCSFMIAKHPETKGKKEEIEKFEKNIDKELAGKAAENSKIIRYFQKIGKI